MRISDLPGFGEASTLHRPLEKLDLKESQRLKVTLEVVPSVVEETRALIRAESKVVQEVAEGDEYLPEGSGT